MARAAFRDLFRTFYACLESLNTSYLAYGGVAVAVWADPRETQDVDAVVAVADEDRDRWLSALQSAGFLAPPEEIRTFAIDGWLRLAHEGRHADVTLGRTPFDRSALERRRRVTLFDLPIWVASPEDLILYKIVAYRYKDLADAEAIVLRQGAKLDLDYMRKWASEIAGRTQKFEVPQTIEKLLRGI